MYIDADDDPYREFTLEQARAELATLLPLLDELLTARADAAEMTSNLKWGHLPRLGSWPEAKAAEAKLDELFATVVDHGVIIENAAPLALDFSSTAKGLPIHYCWLEGETELLWYHSYGAGIAGRRRIPPDEDIDIRCRGRIRERTWPPRAEDLT